MSSGAPNKSSTFKHVYSFHHVNRFLNLRISNELSWVYYWERNIAASLRIQLVLAFSQCNPSINVFSCITSYCYVHKLAIHGNTWQYMTIHGFMNSRFFGGIYVGTIIYIYQCLLIYWNTWQYMAIHDNTWIHEF